MITGLAALGKLIQTAKLLAESDLHFLDISWFGVLDLKKRCGSEGERRQLWQWSNYALGQNLEEQISLTIIPQKKSETLVLGNSHSKRVSDGDAVLPLQCSKQMLLVSHIPKGKNWPGMLAASESSDSEQWQLELLSWSCLGGGESDIGVLKHELSVSHPILLSAVLLTIQGCADFGS